MLKRFVISFLLVVLLSSCSFQSDDLITKQIEVENFDQVNIEIYGEVLLTQGPEYKVSITAPNKLLDLVDVANEEQVLKISTNRWLTSSDPLNITIEAPEIKHVVATHNVVVLANDWQGEEMSFSLSENAKLKGTGFILDNMRSALVQHASLELAGQVSNLDLSVNNQGVFKGSDLLVDNMSIMHNGTENLEVQVNERLVAKLQDEGNIIYKGEAELDIDFAAFEDVGVVKTYENEIIQQPCLNYDIENCPEVCQVCPPCPECSSLQCQSKKSCENLGFPADWTWGEEN